MFKKKSIPQPVNSGVVKVPVVMQLEVLECGAASLTMIMHYYQKWIPLEQARVDCGVSRDGSNIKNIIQAARSYGMIAQAWKVEPEDLLKEGPFPCIIHWGFNHFVVLCGFKGKNAILNDPARGRVTVSWEEFDREYTGICATFEPAEGFEPSGNPKSPFSYAKERLKGTGAAVAFVILTTTISSLIGIITPVFSRIFLDRLLTGKNPDWLIPFITAMSVFAIVNIIVMWIAAIYSIRIQGKLSAIGSASYLWKVLRLPMQFFDQRMPADISDRQATNASIAGTLVNTFAPLALNALMMIFYLIVMLRYSLLMTTVGIGAIAINTENGYFGRWAGFQASVNKQNVRYTKLNMFLGTIPSAISQLANIAVLCIGVFYVLKGHFTIGMVMAFQGFLSSFMSPASSLISAGQSIQEMTTQMERIEDVMSYPSDPIFEPREKKEEYRKLTGEIELKNITFGYSKLGNPLIRDFSMTVHPGQKVAFVGRSGCGKSTLAKLLSGLYEPWSGEILFDGLPISEIDRNVFTGSVAVINQDITLFSDTIANNIKMWDDSIEDFEMILAARDAGIHDDIVQRDNGYRHKMLEGGKDFSGGQRQRIEIAHGLTQDPTICILDEATSALDAKTEYEVVKSISDRGITCIIIAHRLSTIRDCDEIIVLDRGRVVERGTHTELYALGGAYTKLVTNE